MSVLVFTASAFAAALALAAETLLSGWHGTIGVGGGIMDRFVRPVPGLVVGFRF